MAPSTVPFRIFVVKFILLAVIFPFHSGNPTAISLDPISTPPTQCETFTFRWTGGTPPFFVCLYQDGLEQRSLGPTNDWSYSWDSDFPASTMLQATVHGFKSESQTEQFVVHAGPSSECLGSPPAMISPSESNPATPSADPTVYSSTSMSTTKFLTSSPSASASIPPSISAAAPTPPGQSQPPPPSGTDIASTVSSIGPQTSTVSSSYERTSISQTVSNSSDTPDPHTSSISPLLPTPATPDTPLLSLTSLSNPPSAIKPPASVSTQQSALSQPSNGGRVAGIIIGCLAAAVLAALALALLQKRRRAKERSRIASMTTLDTLAFTATTWSDLSPPEPDKDKPLGANKGVTEWNADRFARDRDMYSPAARKQQNARSSSSPSTSPWIPFTISMPQAPFRRRAPRITSLSTIPEASGTETTMPSPVESDDSASTAPSLHSYPPLVPQTLSAGFEDRAPRQHAYYPPMAPPSAQVPVNPFRARLLAAAGNGSGAWGDDLSRDPFR